MMAAATMLSTNDRCVLSALFDAEGIPSKATGSSKDPSASIQYVQKYSEQTLHTLRDQERRVLCSLNQEQPSVQDIEEGIAQLSQIISQYPEYASAYNNRAQAIRMMVGDDLAKPDAGSSTMYSDLCEAIRLACSSDPETTLSSQDIAVLQAAYTHRGHLLYKASKTIAKNPVSKKALPRELQTSGSERLEKLAAADFRLGGEFGNEIARQMAVQLNPYAKLCGEIVREAMIKDMEESGVITNRPSQET